MKISEERWAELRQAVEHDDVEAFQRLIHEIVRASDPRDRATSVVEIEGRKFYGFDDK